LKLLSGARVEAQEEERRRIAREIHDSLGQLLTAIKFNIEVLEDSVSSGSARQERLQDVKRLLDTAMAEAREISYNLMPSVLEDFGLVPALQLLCEQFEKRNGLRLTFHAHGVHERLDPIMEVGLYRIVQEALTNIAKHSQATEASVQFVRDTQGVRLTVEDSGKGFEMARPRSVERRGMGLVSMRERAASFHGSFTIDSTLGSGTVVVVEIPIPNGLAT
jgi:signal transduction histidine kinase